MSDFMNVLPKGVRLGKYEIISVLGRGGFGITYFARDIESQENVAIKEYMPVNESMRLEDGSVAARNDDVAANFDLGREHFMEEARILSGLDHANIIDIYEVFEANNTAYMVMPYQDGESLTAALSRHRGGLPVDNLNMLISGLLEGVAAVHKAGFLHLDIKAGNVFLGRDGQPILLDFGAARHQMKKGRDKGNVGEHGDLRSQFGSPHYAPIEFYEDDAEFGTYSDIYGLAAVFYRAIGRDAPIEAILRKEEDGLTPAIEVGKGRYDEDLLKAIDEGLRLLPEDRPKNVMVWRKEFKLPPIVIMPPEYRGGDKVASASVPKTAPLDIMTERLDGARPFLPVVELKSGGKADVEKNRFGNGAIVALLLLVVSFVGAGAWYFMSGDEMEEVGGDAAVMEMAVVDDVGVKEGLESGLDKDDSFLAFAESAPEFEEIIVDETKAVEEEAGFVMADMMAGVEAESEAVTEVSVDVAAQSGAVGANAPHDLTGGGASTSAPVVAAPAVVPSDLEVSDPLAAAELYAEMADNGDGEAAFKAAQIFDAASPREGAKAAHYYEIAADSGNIDAMRRLGEIFEHGDGVAVNYHESIRRYREAADAGDVASAMAVASIYDEGRGVPQDLTRAASYYDIAATGGDIDAQLKLGGYYYYGMGVARDNDRAVSWYKKAADGGNADAQYNLAVIYDIGQVQTRDSGMAARYYEMAADQGYALAQINLGLLYEMGRGVSVDMARAAELYRAAAEQGEASAQYNLGAMYERGEGVSPNMSEARRWYKEAESQGHSQASLALDRIGR